MQKFMAAALALVILGAGGAEAAGAKAMRMFEMADRDGNGRISATEIAEMRAMRFERLDGNGDGALDGAELDAAAERMRRFTERMAPSRLLRLDTDGDGLVAEAEFVDRPIGPLGERADADGDGEISRAEFEGAIEEWRGR